MINPKIYHDHLGYARKSGWSEIYIHLSRQHQLLIHDCERNSGWYIDTYIHLYYCHHYIKLHNFEMKSGWYQETYVDVLHHLQTLQEFKHQKSNGGSSSGWYIDTNTQEFHYHSY